MSDQNALLDLARQHGGGPVGAPAPDFKTSNVPIDIPRDDRGMPRVSSSLGEGTSLVDQLNEMLGPLAHPQTLVDFARLLTLPVDSVKKALAGALTAAAARPAAGAAVSATGRGLEAVGTSRAAGAAEKLGGAEAVFHLDPKGLAVAAAPTVLRSTGRVLQRAGAFLSGPARAVEPTIGEAAAATPAAADASAAAPPPTAAAAPAAVTAPTNAYPNQKLLNELAIQARRAGVKLTPETEQAAIAAVTKGATPADAVKAVATPTAAAPAAAAEAAPVWTPTKMRLTADEAKVAAKLIQQGLTADEAKVAAKLIQQGKTDQEVQQAIEAARAFRQRFGTPTPTAAQTRFGKGTR